MPDGEDWIMRPVLEGLVKYETILDEKIDLAGIAFLNDALNVRDENNYRLQEARQ